MGENYRQASSEIRRGEETVVIWSLKGWKESHALLRRSNYAVEVVGAGYSSSSGSGPKAQLRFHFEEKQRGTTGMMQGYNTQIKTDWLDLIVDEISNLGGQILQYDIKVDLVDDQGQGIVLLKGNEDAGSLKKTTTGLKKKGSGYGEVTLLSKEFLKLNQTWRDSCNSRTGTTDLPQPEHLNLKIAVTPIYISENVLQAAAAGQKKEEENCNETETTKTYMAPDLRLKTTDGVLIPVHKFVMSAKSPVIRVQLTEEILVKGVSARALRVVVYWIYKGELLDIGGEWIEEVEDAAIKLEIEDLVKALLE